MSWKDTYKNRITTAEKAIKAIKDNVLSHGIDSMAPSYVDYVVTEYGVAKLKGMTFNECAQNLIAIAHPDFREGLTNELNKHKSNS